MSGSWKDWHNTNEVDGLKTGLVSPTSRLQHCEGDIGDMASTMSQHDYTNLKPLPPNKDTLPDKFVSDLKTVVSKQRQSDFLLGTSLYLTCCKVLCGIFQFITQYRWEKVKCHHCSETSTSVADDRSRIMANCIICEWNKKNVKSAIICNTGKAQFSNTSKNTTEKPIIDQREENKGTHRFSRSVSSAIGSSPVGLFTGAILLFLCWAATTAWTDAGKELTGGWPGGPYIFWPGPVTDGCWPVMGGAW